MAGGVWKGFGYTFIILGALALLLGVGAAGFGAYMMNEETNAGVFADEEAFEAGQALLVAGGISAATGVVLLILGGVFLGIGGAAARRELMMLVAMRGGEPVVAAAPLAPAPTAAPAAPRASRSRWVVAGSIAALVLVATIVVGATVPEGGRTAGAFRPNAADDDATQAFTQAYEGHVRGVRAPVVGGYNAAGSSAPHSLAASPGNYVVDGVLNWTPVAGGASMLTLILEVETPDGWEEVARGEGGPGLTVTSAPVDVAASVRARVFLGGAGAADQDYALTLTATPSG